MNHCFSEPYILKPTESLKVLQDRPGEQVEQKKVANGYDRRELPNGDCLLLEIFG